MLKNIIFIMTIDFTCNHFLSAMTPYRISSHWFARKLTLSFSLCTVYESTPVLLIKHLESTPVLLIKHLALTATRTDQF
jgi:hypothetical protein